MLSTREVVRLLRAALKSVYPTLDLRLQHTGNSSHMEIIINCVLCHIYVTLNIEQGTLQSESTPGLPYVCSCTLISDRTCCPAKLLSFVVSLPPTVLIYTQLQGRLIGSPYSALHIYKMLLTSAQPYTVGLTCIIKRSAKEPVKWMG